MKSKLSKGATAAVVAIVLTLLATAAVAGTGVGGVFNLGQANTVNATSVLTGSANAPMLKVVNTNTGTSARGIRIETPSNRAPLIVTSSKKVLGLNSDLLDGHEANSFGRIASTGHEDSGSIATFSGIVSTVIEAPAAGSVLVTGQVMAETSDGNCTPCNAWVRLRHVESDTYSPVLGHTVVDGQSTTLGPVYVFAVAQGTNTFEMQTAMFGNFANRSASYRNEVVAAIYSPFDGAGLVPATPTVTTAREEGGTVQPDGSIR